MPANKKFEIAEDGVQEVPLAKARPALGRLIDQAREEQLVSALTAHGRRRVYIVSPEFYGRAMAALGEEAPPGEREDDT